MGKRIKFIIIALGICISIVQADGSRNNMEYSLVFPSTKKFINFLHQNNITKNTMQQVYKNPYSSPRYAFLYALAYDYAQANGNVNKYYLIAFNHNISIGNKSAFYEYLDYLIRTNHPKNILKLINVPTCLNTGDYPKCLYYLGIAKYLVNGKCNSYLKIAANHQIQKGLFFDICQH